MGQPGVLRDVPGFFQHDPMGDEQGIDITGHTRGIVSQGHRSAANDEHVRNDAPADKPLAQGSETPAQARPAKQNASGLVRAASRSWRIGGHHAYGTRPVPGPGRQPAGSGVPPGTTAAAEYAAQPTAEARDRAAPQDAQLAPPATRPIARHQYRAARPAQPIGQPVALVAPDGTWCYPFLCACSSGDYPARLADKIAGDHGCRRTRTVLHRYPGRPPDRRADPAASAPPVRPQAGVRRHVAQCSCR